MCTIIISLAIGIIYLRVKLKIIKKLERNSAASILANLSSLFISSLFIGLFSCLSSLPAILAERPVIYREIDRNIINPFAYAISFTISEIPYTILLTYPRFLTNRLIVMLFCYPLVGYNTIPESVGFYFLLLLLTLMFFSFLGQFFSFLIPTLQVLIFLIIQIGVLAGAVALAVMNILCGFWIPLNQLYTFFKIIYWINPLQYIVTALISTQMRCISDCPVFIFPDFVSHTLNYLDFR